MKKAFFYGYIIVVVIFVLQLVMFGPRVSFGVFIKPLNAQFDWSVALISGAFSISSLVQAISSIVMGWLNDKRGPRFVLTICGMLVGSGLILMFLVDAVWQLYLFYGALIGVGMGGLVAPQMSTIARWFVRRRNIMTAVLMTGGGLGGLIGPPLITWLIYTYTWQKAYLFIGIGVFLLMVLPAQFLRRDPSQMGQVPYGDNTQSQARGPSVAKGLSSKQALQTKRFWLFALAIFCVGFCLWTVMVHIVPCAIDRGISPRVAAVILAVMNGAQPVGSIVMGIVSERIGNRRSLVTCVSLLSAVILLLFPVTNPWLLGLILMVIAFGLGGISVVQSSITAELFGMKSHGTILGYTVFTFSIGGALGTYIGGSVFDATGSYQIVFLICGVLILAAIFMVILLNRLSQPVYSREIA
jgi:MFS family permease